MICHAQKNVQSMIVIQATAATSQINNVKITNNNNIKFLENISQGFKTTIATTQVAVQPKNDKLDYLTDLTFRNVNRLFVPLFKNNNGDATRNYFYEYYLPLVELKDFNAVIDNVVNGVLILIKHLPCH